MVKIPCSKTNRNDPFLELAGKNYLCRIVIRMRSRQINMNIQLFALMLLPVNYYIPD